MISKGMQGDLRITVGALPPGESMWLLTLLFHHRLWSIRLWLLGLV